MKTVGGALADAVTRLEAAGLDEARIKSEWLLAGLLRKQRWQLAAEQDSAISAEQSDQLAAALERLARHEPLQYVLGEAEFHGRIFQCDARALIPRPETEELVESCLKHRNLWSRPDPCVADVGTGTGCIAITLALERPKARVVAIDQSEDALALARVNAVRLGADANLEFRRGDLLVGFAPGSLDGVISNPPYLSEAELAETSPEVQRFEPRSALVAGVDGTEVFQRLIIQAFGVLRPGGMVWLEMGSTQSDQVSSLLEKAGFRSIQVARDLAGLPRVASARKP